MVESLLHLHFCMFWPIWQPFRRYNQICFTQKQKFSANNAVQIHKQECPMTGDSNRHVISKW